jgi:hypothetical protein
MPFPFVLLPDRVSPFPLKLSQWSPPLLTVVCPVLVPANAPAIEDEGLDEPGEPEFKSILSFDAMVAEGVGFGRSG